MNTDSRDIAAVVVTHQSASTLDACLQRLRDAEGVAQIRVVDNASTDDTLDIVLRHATADARVHFIANPDNPGFAVACNQGAADSSARWLAFVNPDLMVEADTLACLRMQAKALGPCLLGVDLIGEDGMHDAAARRRDPDFAAMLRTSAARRLDVPSDGASLQRVDAVSGALMLLPRDLFLRLHGFDEGYRLHAEDLDLCRRARQSGAEVAIVNALVVRHVRGVSSRSRPVFVEFHKHRGLWRYFRTFEAARHGAATRCAVWLMIWAHFPLAVAGAWRRR
ncbi:MAG TPA: glycosyltransferase family 2 protein [Xanthomonadaceae bacterium]|nr:glycosyltransferase family 2 protein [Xanthomonadaceae bacterium]